nr:hypothetical protein CKG001_14730 [Bdellovibrio sp. CKG001]
MYKRWGIENYIALGEMLIAQGYYVGFIIGPSEQEYVSRLSESESRFVVHQDLDFASLVRTIASYEILINNDSGVGHIAAGLGLKIVSLYGPTDPNLYKPLSSKIKIIQKLPVMACMPCYDKNRSRYGCSLKPCMADITVDRVLESVLSFNE